MLSRKTFWTVTLAVAVLGIAGGALIGDSLLHRPIADTEAFWAEIYNTPVEMAGRADAVVVGKAVGVEHSRFGYSDNGEDALPFEVAEFEIIRNVKGLSGETRVFVERAGGEGVYIDADGGPFEIGQSYLLFLKRQEEGPSYYQANSQARFRIANGRLQSLEKGDVVVDALHGRTLSEGLSLVRDGLRERGPAVQ